MLIQENFLTDNAGLGLLLEDAFAPVSWHNVIEANEISDNGVGAPISRDVPSTLPGLNNMHNNPGAVWLKASEGNHEVDASGHCGIVPMARTIRRAMT